MAVRALADERLPAVVSRLRQGEDVDVAAEAPPLALRTRTREVAMIADAFSAVQRTAVEAAVGQAELRKGVSNVFRSLARRNQSLLQRQLKMLDAMERRTEDPDALAQLFRVDHLTTRMRRHAEGLIILSGAQPGRGWREPVPLVEVLRGAVGEIEDYARVDMIIVPGDLVPGTAVADVTHLLAELIENAALYSPPHTRVQVTASRVASGFAVEVEDRGLGIPPRDAGYLQRPAGQPAGVRPGRQRPARPVRRQPTGRPARNQGNAARITLRRDLSHRADATPSRVGRRSGGLPIRGRCARGRRTAGRGRRISRWRHRADTGWLPRSPPAANPGRREAGRIRSGFGRCPWARAGRHAGAGGEGQHRKPCADCRGHVSRHAAARPPGQPGSPAPRRPACGRWPPR